MKAHITVTQIGAMLRRNSTNGDCAEAMLWVAIIVQAFHDALHNRNPGIRGQASRWFQSKAFDEACDNAGLDAEYVRDIFNTVSKQAVIRQQRGRPLHRPARLAA